MQSSPSKSMCPKHQGYEQIYFNSKEGKRQCLLCILNENKGSPVKDKERFCIKHNGYENLFFCYNDKKAFCEKCLIYHKEHQVQAIALKSMYLKEDYRNFKTQFDLISINWANFCEKLKSRKRRIDKNIDKTVQEIQKIFDTTIEKIKDQKSITIAEFKGKSNEIFKEFYELFSRTNAHMKEIIIKTEEIRHEFNSAFSKQGNPIDLIQFSIDKNVDDLFSHFCESKSVEFEKEKLIYEKVKSLVKIPYKIENEFNVSELIDYINKQFVIKLSNDALEENSIDELSENEKADKQKNLISSTMNSNKLIDISKVKMHRFDKDSKKMIYFSDSNKEEIEVDVNSLCTKISNNVDAALDISGDVKTYRLEDEKIIAYAIPTQTMFIFNETTKCFEPFINLKAKMKKISITQIQDKIYIYGENAEEDSRESPNLLAIDLSRKQIQEITNLSRIGSYTLCNLNNKILVAIPHQINTQKLILFNLENVYNEDQFAPSTEQVSIKIPTNLSISVNSNSYAISINESEIAIFTVKGIAILDVQQGIFEDLHPYKTNDEFNDGIYLSGMYVQATGRSGLHSFSLASKRWLN